MKSSVLRTAMLALGVVAATPSGAYAQEPDAAGVSLPVVSATTVGPMKQAFADMPVACRKSVQQGLRVSGGYRGSANGRWSTDLGNALVSYVLAAGNLAIGWPSVPGSKGILWHASADNSACPPPPYR